MSIFQNGAYYPLGLGGEISEAEYEYQYALCNEPPDDCDPPPPLEMSPGYWRTRDGQVLEIKSMSATHIANAVALFERSGWPEHDKIRELRAELNRRAKKLRKR